MTAATVYLRRLAAPQRAVDTLEPLLATGHADPNELIVVARAYEACDRPSDALKIYERLLEQLGPAARDSTTIRRLGWTYYKLARLADARTTCEDVSQARDPYDRVRALVIMAAISALEHRDADMERLLASAAPDDTLAFRYAWEALHDVAYVAVRMGLPSPPESFTLRLKGMDWT